MPKVEYRVSWENPRGYMSKDGIWEGYLRLSRDMLDRAADDYANPHCMFDPFTEHDGEEWAGFEVSKAEILDFVRHKPTLALWVGLVDIDTAQKGFAKRIGAEI